MTTFDESADFVIVGSGGAGLSAALRARSLGKSVIILEKTDKLGGSTAISGGVLWIPDNPVMQRDGVADSYDTARTYMDGVIGDAGLASSPARRHAFLSMGPKVIAFLDFMGIPFRRPSGYSDHYDERPGGLAEGRALVVPLFNLRALGPWQAKLRRLGAFALPLSIEEFNGVALAKRTWKGRLTAVKLAYRFLKQKLLGQDIVGCGCALAGRLLQAAVRAGVDIRVNAAVREIIMDGPRVTGVRMVQDGQERRIGTRNGVLIAAGGFSHNLAMRRQYGDAPASTAWTNAQPGDTGEMIEEAMRIGAGVDLMDQAWWNIVSVPPFDMGLKPIHSSDTAKPHCILVDSSGRRFCNEAASYMEVGKAIYRHNKNVPAIPCFMIFDSAHRNSYPLFVAPPGITPKEWLETGYVKRTETLADLAAQCGIDPQGLEETVARFNTFAVTGKDADFKRGERAYDRWYADPSVKPNPSLGDIAKPPYYAMALWPGDVGTSGGLLTDEHARVMRADGTVIAGLYAAGNCTASVMGRAYPGSGASIGAAVVFGHIAAEHACRAHAR